MSILNWAVLTYMMCDPRQSRNTKVVVEEFVLAEYEKI